MSEVEGVAAFHTQVSLAHGRVELGLHLHDAAFAGADVHLAAHAAIGTRGPRPVGWRSMREDGLILKRARRTGVHARAAAHAGTGEQRRTIRHDARVVARAGHVPDELSLHFAANAHATEAVDALGVVGGEIRMSGVFEHRSARCGEDRGSSASIRIGRNLDFIVPQPPMKLFLRPLLHRFRRIILREQPQQRAPRLLDLRCVRLHLHPVGHGRGTGRDEMIRSLHAHQTETTRTSGLEPIVVTERRDFDANATAGGQDGHSLRDAALLPVESHLRHEENSFPQLPPRSD